MLIIFELYVEFEIMELMSLVQKSVKTVNNLYRNNSVTCQGAVH